MDATTASFGLNKATTRKRPAAFRCSKMMAWPNEAKEALEIKRHDRRENVLPSAGRKPMLFAFIET